MSYGRRNRRSGALALVELTVVIAIPGILAAFQHRYERVRGLGSIARYDET